MRIASPTSDDWLTQGDVIDRTNVRLLEGLLQLHEHIAGRISSPPSWASPSTSVASGSVPIRYNPSSPQSIPVGYTSESSSRSHLQPPHENNLIPERSQNRQVPRANQSSPAQPPHPPSRSSPPAGLSIDLTSEPRYTSSDFHAEIPRSHTSTTPAHRGGISSHRNPSPAGPGLAQGSARTSPLSSNSSAPAHDVYVTPSPPRNASNPVGPGSGNSSTRTSPSRRDERASEQSHSPVQNASANPNDDVTPVPTLSHPFPAMEVPTRQPTSSPSHCQASLRRADSMTSASNPKITATTADPIRSASAPSTRSPTPFQYIDPNYESSEARRSAGNAAELRFRLSRVPPRSQANRIYRANQTPVDSSRLSIDPVAITNSASPSSGEPPHHSPPPPSQTPSRSILRIATPRVGSTRNEIGSTIPPAAQSARNTQTETTSSPDVLRHSTTPIVAPQPISPAWNGSFRDTSKFVEIPRSASSTPGSTVDGEQSESPQPLLLENSSSSGSSGSDHGHPGGGHCNSPPRPPPPRSSTPGTGNNLHTTNALANSPFPVPPLPPPNIHYHFVAPAPVILSPPQTQFASPWPPVPLWTLPVSPPTSVTTPTRPPVLSAPTCTVRPLPPAWESGTFPAAGLGTSDLIRIHPHILYNPLSPSQPVLHWDIVLRAEQARVVTGQGLISCPSLGSEAVAYGGGKINKVWIDSDTPILAWWMRQWGPIVIEKGHISVRDILDAIQAYLAVPLTNGDYRKATEVPTQTDGINHGNGTRLRHARRMRASNGFELRNIALRGRAIEDGWSPRLMGAGPGESSIYRRSDVLGTYRRFLGLRPIVLSDNTWRLVLGVGPGPVPRMLLQRVSALIFLPLLVVASNGALADDMLVALTSAVDCPSCHSLLVTLKATAVLGDKALSRSLKSLCRRLKLADSDVCNGIIDSIGPIVAHDLRSISPFGETSSKFCNAILGLCPEPPVNNFTVPFPKPPPESPKEFKSSGKPPFRVVHFSDIHIDRDYLTGSEANCTKPLCCRAFEDQNDPVTTPAGPLGYPTCDTPLKLADSVAKAIDATDSLFSIFTGDIVDSAVWLVNQKDVKADINLFSEEFRMALSAPVFPTLGNHESSPVNCFPRLTTEEYAKDSQWVFNTSSTQWSPWIGQIAADQVIHHSGSYSLVVSHSNLRIISVNSGFWYKMNLWLYDSNKQQPDPNGILSFLVSQLQVAEDLGQRAWIMAHMPPGGGDVFHDQSNYYDQVVQRYKHTIAGQFFGHTHNDEFQLAYSNYSDRTKDTATSMAWIVPALTPRSGNPAFKVYDIDPDTYEVIDVHLYSTNMSHPDYQIEPTWNLLYSARDLYGSLIPGGLEPSQSLSPSFWHQLTELFENDDEAFQTFQHLKRRIGGGDCIQDEDEDAYLDCKRRVICQLRAQRSEDNCYELTQGGKWLVDGTEPAHAENIDHGCEGVGAHTLFKQMISAFVRGKMDASTTNAIRAQLNEIIVDALEDLGSPDLDDVNVGLESADVQRVMQIPA
ncbi:hypothetical protein D9757_004127 [Collybiopsis confluens]|uniref:Saposin B-type domain-containing protein n=1 Tax=Collybiopsis confluens TaxID=2823264 RepID=A0A8H5HUM1_9AGAR|nr:hypothetical protein D9757_004127 [Collybiopsis confluens]